MKKGELTKLRTKKETELRKLVSDKKLLLARVIADVKASREKNLKKAKNLRRDIAQILTIFREKELIEQERKTEQKRGATETPVPS